MKFESEIQKITQKTRLKAIEREMVRDRILSYMEYHPLKKDVVSPLSLSELRDGEFFYIHFNSFWMKIGSGVLTLILVVGVPILAERSVPGDVLYLVKTEVNEGIRTQLASTPYEKVELETKLMERRIAEARLLAQEGKLTEEVEAQIAETVKNHANAVQTGLSEIREHDTDGAAIAEIVFNSALEVQSAVLGVSETASSSSVENILEVVNTVRDEVASDNNPRTPSYDGLVARIESETTRAYELFAMVKRSATAEEIADVERRLSDIDRSIVGAKIVRESDEAGSVTNMTETLGLIQKLIAFMTDIDIRETVTLEALVPVILTPEERILAVEKIMVEVESSKVIVGKKVELITETSLYEKVVGGLTLVGEEVANVAVALGEGNIDGAESHAKIAQDTVRDLEILTEEITFTEEVMFEESVMMEEAENIPSNNVPTTTEVSPQPEEEVAVESIQ